jgi:Bacterial Ig-like domain (group 3)
MGTRGRVAALFGIVAAAISLVGAGAGAGAESSSGGAASLAGQLSTAQGAARYLRTLGIDPRGVVVQRGLRNYAGRSCPGADWNCTSARRVLQVAAAGGTNSSTCSRVGSGTGVTSQSCVIVQTGTHGKNSATCYEQATGAGASLVQECTIRQTSTSGVNEAKVTQRSTQGPSCSPVPGTTQQQSQAATQRATVVQSSASGPMDADVTQDAGQCVSRSGTASVAQEQTTFQEFTITQGPEGFNPASPSCPTKSGTLDADASQSQRQSGHAATAGSGTQRQRADLIGHVDQCSLSHAEYDATQTENQFLAPNASVDQTQIGPAKILPGPRALLGKGKRGLARGECCTFQGTNPSDRCSITQQSSQQANGDATQTEELTSRAGTTGTCRANISATQNESTATTSASGSSFEVTLRCRNGDCGPPKVETALDYIGPTYGRKGSYLTFKGKLSHEGGVISGRTITFTLGSQSCSGTTDGYGVAKCTIRIAQPPGTYTLTASFAGDTDFEPATDSVAFQVKPPYDD